MENYQHIDLCGQRSIRIIVLDPSSDPASEIRCGLYSASLDYPLDFEALSYSWDGQTPSEPIFCRTLRGLDGAVDTNGPYGILKVTQNCLNALRALRAEAEQRFLWIDGICINQESIDEKNLQVPLMSELYGAATNVIVWLGEKDEAAEQSFRFIHDVGGPMEELRAVYKKYLKNMPQSRGLKEIMKDNPAEKIMAKLTALFHTRRDVDRGTSNDPLKSLFDRSWFQRMWTVQEVVLPFEGDITFHCGDLSVWFPTLLLVTKQLENFRFTKSGIRTSMKLQMTIIDELHKRRQRRLLEDGDRMVLPADTNLTNWSELRRKYDRSSSPVEVKLTSIFGAARNKLATDSKDKVFALHGILQNMQIPIPNPNYHKSVEEVYLDATVAAISSDNSLEILYHVASEKRLSSLPSWIPDLSQHSFGSLDPRDFHNDAERFRAGSNLTPQWDFLPGRRIRVRGKILDIVASRLPSIDPYVTSLKDHPDNIRLPDLSEAIRRDMHKAFNVLRLWVDFCQKSGITNGNRKDGMNDAFMRTILNDDTKSIQLGKQENLSVPWLSILSMDDRELAQFAIRSRELQKSSEAASKIAASDDSQLVKQIRTWSNGMRSAVRQRDSRSKSVLAKVLETVELSNISLSAISHVLSFHLHILRVARRKALFATGAGRFGMAPDLISSPVQQGDKIAVIAGLGLPVVLRPNEDGSCALVSHCYVDGLMHGEGLHDLDFTGGSRADGFGIVLS